MPSAVWPGAGCSSSSSSPIPQRPGTGSTCGSGMRQRPGALDVVLLVEVAQLALRAPRLGLQAPAVGSPMPSGASGKA